MHAAVTKFPGGYAPTSSCCDPLAAAHEVISMHQLECIVRTTGSNVGVEPDRFRPRREYGDGHADSADGVAVQTTRLNVVFPVYVIADAQRRVRPGARGGCARGANARGGVSKVGEDVLAEHDAPRVGPGVSDVALLERALLLRGLSRPRAEKVQCWRRAGAQERREIRVVAFQLTAGVEFL